MTQIAIPDDLAAKIGSEAAHRGCSSGELVEQLLTEGLQPLHVELTPAAQARIVESIEQAKRGEVVDGDIVMARFEKVLQEIEAQ